MFLCINKKKFIILNEAELLNGYHMHKTERLKSFDIDIKKI